MSLGSTEYESVPSEYRDDLCWHWARYLQILKFYPFFFPLPGIIGNGSDEGHAG